MKSPLEIFRPHCRRVAGFTLLELLLVMAVISVTTLLVIPATGILWANELTSAGNGVLDATTMARLNSVSKNTYTAIVIKTQGDSAYSAYCLLDLVRNDDGSFGDWRTVVPWKNLPSGVIFSSDASSSAMGDFLAGASTGPSPLPTQFPFHSDKIDLTPGKPTTGAIVQIFQPDGTLVDAKQSLKLRLCGGAVDSTGKVIYTRGGTGGSGAASPANYYDIVVIRDTGQTLVDRS